MRWILIVLLLLVMPMASAETISINGIRKLDNWNDSAMIPENELNSSDPNMFHYKCVRDDASNWLFYKNNDSLALSKTIFDSVDCRSDSISFEIRTTKGGIAAKSIGNGTGRRYIPIPNPVVDVGKRFQFDNKFTVIIYNSTSQWQADPASYWFSKVNGQVRANFNTTYFSGLTVGDIIIIKSDSYKINGSTSPAWQNTSFDNTSIYPPNKTIVLLKTIDNLTTYTETDPNGNLSETTTRVTATLINRNIDTHLSYDYGAEFFKNFRVWFDSNYTYSPSSYGVMCFQISGAADDCFNVAQGVIVDMRPGGVTGKVYFELKDRGSGGATSGGLQRNQNTTYYHILERNGNIVKDYIYDDSARTNLLETLSITQTSINNYRYVVPITSFNDGNNHLASGYVENVKIKNVITGNSTHNYSFQSGRQASQFMINFTNASGIYADAYTSADNITYNLAMSNVTNATLTNFPVADKAQNSFVRFNCKGNTTATCENMEVTITDEAVSGDGAVSNLTRSYVQPARQYRRDNQ